MTSRRFLPLLEASEHLAFHCNGCGGCCRALRVALTHFDLARLSRGTGQPLAALVEWLPAGGVGPSGEPDSFVELDRGRCLMVLAHSAGACLLLDAENRCTAYAARPYDCRLFPFDLERGAEGGVVALARLPLEGCNDEPGDRRELCDIASEDLASRYELSAYQALVKRWNQLSAHRKRFGRRAGSSAEFLAFVAAAATSAGAPRDDVLSARSGASL